MGIKLFAFVRRAPGMSPANFHSYWRDEHAAHIAETPGLRRHLRRYELNHRLVEDYAREPHAAEVASGDYDGVAVMWFDSASALAAFNAEPGFADWRVADSPRFRAPEIASVMTDDAAVIVDTPHRDEAGAMKQMAMADLAVSDLSVVDSAMTISTRVTAAGGNTACGARRGTIHVTKAKNTSNSATGIIVRWHTSCLLMMRSAPRLPAIFTASV